MLSSTKNCKIDLSSSSSGDIKHIVKDMTSADTVQCNTRWVVKTGIQRTLDLCSRVCVHVFECQLIFTKETFFTRRQLVFFGELANRLTTAGYFSLKASYHRRS